MTRLIQWINNVVRDPDTQPEVHFHQGSWSTDAPVVCYDERCGAPRLQV